MSCHSNHIAEISQSVTFNYYMQTNKESHNYHSIYHYYYAYTNFLCPTDKLLEKLWVKRTWDCTKYCLNSAVHFIRDFQYLSCICTQILCLTDKLLEKPWVKRTWDCTKYCLNSAVHFIRDFQYLSLYVHVHKFSLSDRQVA